ncbi:MAG: undecaprenyl-diphosphatase [Magnetovibrio sp.]|nr:undecaprenyl-diphosphatase [Magnetovibrio sp.]
METALPWNIALFHLINASALPSPFMVLTAKFFAAYAPWLTIVISVLFWFRGTPHTRRTLMVAGIALGIGLSVNFSIARLIYVPRPFELGIGQTFLNHSLETSFPSDHATFLWSLALSLMASRNLRWLGRAIFFLGLATAWARVYLGVHFPVDMVASFAIAFSAAGSAHFSAPKLDRILFQPVERLNKALLKSLAFFS